MILWSSKWEAWGIAEKQNKELWHAHRLYLVATAVTFNNKRSDFILGVSSSALRNPPLLAHVCQSLPLEAFDPYLLGRTALPALSNSWSVNLSITGDLQKNE